MKKIILALAIAASTLSAQAYDVFDNKDNHPYYGVRASYELMIPSDVEVGPITNMEYFNSSSGFSVGAIYNMPLWKNLYFEPGVTLYYNTLSMKRLVAESVLAEVNVNGINVANAKVKDASIRQFGVRIPLMVGYHFDFLPSLRIAPFTGPEIALGFSSCAHIDLEGGYAMTHSAYGSGGMLNRFDIKWRFGVGATFLQHYYGAISGAIGLCDQARRDGSMTTSVVDLTFGYNF